MKILEMLTFTVVAALSFSLALAGQTTCASRPDIVLMFPDNLGWGEVKVDIRITSPHAPHLLDVDVVQCVGRLVARIAVVP